MGKAGWIIVLALTVGCFRDPSPLEGAGPEGSSEEGGTGGDAEEATSAASSSTTGASTTLLATTDLPGTTASTSWGDTGDAGGSDTGSTGAASSSSSTGEPLPPVFPCDGACVDGCIDAGSHSACAEQACPCDPPFACLEALQLCYLPCADLDENLCPPGSDCTSTTVHGGFMGCLIYEG